MEGRPLSLLPLLLLLLSETQLEAQEPREEAPGLNFSGLQEPNTMRMPKGPFRGHLRLSGGTWQGSPPTRLLLPHLATPSIRPTTKAAKMEPNRTLGATVGTTQIRSHEAGKVESREAPGLLGGNGPPRLPPVLVPTKFMTLLPMLALLPMAVSPKEGVRPTPSPSPASKGNPNLGTRQGASGGWQHVGVPLPQLLGSGVSVAVPSSWTKMASLIPRPGKGGPVGATAAQDGISSTVMAEASEPPRPTRRACSPTAQEVTEVPIETGGTLLASVWQPVGGTTEPGLACLPVNSATSGQVRDVATLPAELAWTVAPLQGSGPVVLGGEGLPEELGSREVFVVPTGTSGPLLQSGPPEHWTSEGPGTAMPPTPVPPRPGEGLDLLTERMEEDVLQDNLFGNLVTSSVPRATDSLQEAKTPTEAPTSSSSAVAPADRKEKAPHSSSPLSWGVFSSNSPQPSTSLGKEPSTGTLTPGPSLPPLPTGLDWLSLDPLEGAGWYSRGQMDPSQSSPGSLVFSDAALIPAEALPEGPFTNLGENGGTFQSPSEPFSTSATKEGDPIWLSSWPSQLPPSWPGKGVSSSGTAPHLTEASASPGAPTDTMKSPQGLPQVGEGAQVGTTTTEGAETPTCRTPGRVGEAAGQTASPTEWPVASHAMEGDPSPSQDPALLSKMAVFSSPSPERAAVPTSEEGRTVVPSHLSVTQQLWTSLAGTQGWGSHSRNPMKEVTLLPHYLETFQTASSGRPRGGWQTWPPMPAPDLGSIAREEPPVASTWLLASVPEEEEGATTARTPHEPAMPREGRPRAHPVFVAENQPPLLKATLLHIPCELVLAMEFSRSFQDPESPEYRNLVISVNETITPLLASLPGFQRLEVKTIRPGSVVVGFDALFLAKAPGLWAALNRSSLSERLPPGLWVANASVLRSMTQERHLDLCTILFSCQAGYECIAEGGIGRAICISLCHRDYCKNQGICTHAANHTPVCQCPVGSDFWFLGVRCDYKVTQQGILGVACGLLLSLVVVGVAVAGLVIRRVRLLLLEARADQTKSSYRRFCRLDDVSAHYWSEPWLASASSLDNPAFSNSEELLHLQILDTGCYGCQEEPLAPEGYGKHPHDGLGAAGRPSSGFHWDESSNSANDPMIDSGKASEVSICSWPMKPIQWSPFPAIHNPPREQENHRADKRPLRAMTPAHQPCKKAHLRCPRSFHFKTSGDGGSSTLRGNLHSLTLRIFFLMVQWISCFVI